MDVAKDPNLSPEPVEMLSLGHSNLYNRRSKNKSPVFHLNDYEDLESEYSDPPPRPTRPHPFVLIND